MNVSVYDNDHNNDSLIFKGEESSDLVVADVAKKAYKMTLLQAEEHLSAVQQYIEDSDAPVIVADSIHCIANELRAPNTSKPRQPHPTIQRWFKTK